MTESLAKHLSSQFLDYTLINVDDLLASAEGVEKDKELIIDATNKGILVDPKIVTTAIKTKILSSAGKKFIVEGYPRCKAELDAWADSCSDQCFYDTVIYVDSPLETMKANLSANEKTAPLSNALLSTFVELDSSSIRSLLTYQQAQGNFYRWCTQRCHGTKSLSSLTSKCRPSPV